VTDPNRAAVRDGTDSYGVAEHQTLADAEAAYRERLEELQREIAYWRGVLAQTAYGLRAQNVPRESVATLIERTLDNGFQP
jgi:hypothetical protein